MQVASRLFSCLASIAVAVSISQAAEKPNIIVFYTDDHGHADLSCQDVLDDVRTPNVDLIAASGVRAMHGYSTAPQCVPSRAGLLTGRFQSRFGVETNGSELSGFDQQTTIAERLQAAGYMTAQFGKWHLGPSDEITNHGFKHVFAQNSGRPFRANITIDGKDRLMSDLKPEMYHVDACSHAAVSLIHRYADQPMFLYVAYRAPHVPLDAPAEYLNRFPGEMPQRRRQALAMISAVDDGVGLVMDALKQHQLVERTLVFFIGDNGAPLKIDKADTPGSGSGWDGSLNDPLNGEKGMLAEGGMHTPFIVSWPGTIISGQQYPYPISALDVAATATSVADIETTADELDGVDLIPFLTGTKAGPPHESLLWRWGSQSAVRAGKWKLLRGADREYLYDLDADMEEQHNLVAAHPEIANRLRAKLQAWANELTPPGLESGKLVGAASDYFDFYLDKKSRKLVQDKSDANPSKRRSALPSDWIARNATLVASDEGWIVAGDPSAERPLPFVTRSGLGLAGPVTVKLLLKTSMPGPVNISWRTSKTKDFDPVNLATVDVDAIDKWQTFEVNLDTTDIAHIRVHVPGGKTWIKQLELIPSQGKPIALE